MSDEWMPQPQDMCPIEPSVIQEAFEKAMGRVAHEMLVHPVSLHWFNLVVDDGTSVSYKIEDIPMMRTMLAMWDMFPDERQNITALPLVSSLSCGL